MSLYILKGFFRCDEQRYLQTAGSQQQQKEKRMKSTIHDVISQSSSFQRRISKALQYCSFVNKETGVKNHTKTMYY